MKCARFVSAKYRVQYASYRLPAIDTACSAVDDQAASFSPVRWVYCSAAFTSEPSVLSANTLFYKAGFFYLVVEKGIHFFPCFDKTIHKCMLSWFDLTEIE